MEPIRYYAYRESVPASEMTIGEPYSVVFMDPEHNIGISFASYLRGLTMNSDGVYCTSWENGVVVATSADIYMSITVVDTIEGQAREYVRMGVVDADYFSFDIGDTTGLPSGTEG